MRYRSTRGKRRNIPDPRNLYGMNFNCPVEDEWVFRLIAAIIVRAREDYVLGDDTVPSFVYSYRFAAITEIDPDWFMERLVKARREKSRKYNCRDWREKFDR